METQPTITAAATAPLDAFPREALQGLSQVCDRMSALLDPLDPESALRKTLDEAQELLESSEPYWAELSDWRDALDRRSYAVLIVSAEGGECERLLAVWKALVPPMLDREAEVRERLHERQRAWQRRHDPSWPRQPKRGHRMTDDQMREALIAYFTHRRDENGGEPARFPRSPDWERDGLGWLWQRVRKPKRYGLSNGVPEWCRELRQLDLLA